MCISQSFTVASMLCDWWELIRAGARHMMQLIMVFLLTIWHGRNETETYRRFSTFFESILSTGQFVQGNADHFTRCPK